jgi:hypothetical protein
VYRGYWDCLRKTLVQEGPRALYRGCLINCVKTVPGAGLQFVAYDLIKTSIQVGRRAACLCSAAASLPAFARAAGGQARAGGRRRRHGALLWMRARRVKG